MELTKRQNEIIDAALSLTASNGIQGLTVKHISSAIGVTEPALYRHFKNKSEIVKAMISRFELKSIPLENKRGFDVIESFVMARIEQVLEKPDLARVLFAEELFMNDHEFTNSVLDMMHKHKKQLEVFFIQAQEDGEIRKDIPMDILFRLVIGPVRLLVKQWGMSKMAFDLREKGAELILSLRKTLKPQKIY